MRGPVKKFLLLLLLWSGFGFALNEYLEHKPNDSGPVSNDLPKNAQDNKGESFIIESSSEQSSSSESEIEQSSSKSAIEQSSNSSLDSGVEIKIDPDYEAEEYSSGAQTLLQLNNQVLTIVRNSAELNWQNDWSKIVNQLTYNMTKNPSLTLEIIGHFDPSEPIADPNLGVQRSVRIKNKLVASGLNPDRIRCRGNLQRLFDSEATITPIVIKASEPLLEASQFEEPLSASVSGTSEQVFIGNSGKGSKENANDPKINQDGQYVDDKADDTPARINPNLPKFNTVVYQPTFSDQGIVVDTDLVNLIPGVRQWLDLDSKNFIEIWGHTDHVGHEQDNYRLALKWARQARSFLITKGIDPNRIQALSAGEQQPLYTNSNLRGRQKNRRLELIFKF